MGVWKRVLKAEKGLKALNILKTKATVLVLVVVVKKNNLKFFLFMAIGF